MENHPSQSKPLLLATISYIIISQSVKTVSETHIILILSYIVSIESNELWSYNNTYFPWIFTAHIPFYNEWVSLGILLAVISHQPHIHSSSMSSFRTRLYIYLGWPFYASLMLRSALCIMNSAKSIRDKQMWNVGVSIGHEFKALFKLLWIIFCLDQKVIASSVYGALKKPYVWSLIHYWSFS